MNNFIRSLSFAPSTLDRESGRFEAVALPAGGAPVRRPAPAPDGTRSPWIEELDARSADLSVLIGGPLLTDHLNRVSASVGTVEAARVEGDRIITVARFDGSPEATAIMGKVSAGSVRGTSLGYRVTEWTRSGTRDGLPVFRATRWVPHELSLTPIPASPGAFIRNSEDRMETTTESTTAPAVVNTSDAPAMSRAQINGEIRSIARAAGLPGSWADEHIDHEAGIDQVRAAALDELKRRSAAPISTATVHVVHDHNDPAALTRAMSDALAARLSPATVKLDPTSRATEFMGMRMIDMARDLSAARGERLPRNDAAAADMLFRSAHSTSDFPLLLENAVNKAMLPSYSTAAPTYRQFFAQRSFNDFRAHKFLRIGDFPSLQEITAENGEPKYGTVSENREEVTAKEYGTGISITRKALVNDDLGALQNFTGMIGVRVASDENAMAYALLGQNSGAGPNLSDANPVFHAASHANRSAGGTVLDVANVAAAVKAMREQKSLDGIALNIAPRYLVIGPANELKARQLLASIIPNQVSSVNPWSGMLELVTDANITDYRWYIMADPGLYPCFVYGYVNGTSGPVVRSEIDFDTRAFKIAVGLDFGIGAVDFRGGYFNAGAAS